MSLDFSKLEIKVAEDARLTILRALATAPGNEMNETLLHDVLDHFGHNRTREWVRQQMRKLSDVGGIVLEEAGNILVATLTRAGLDHIERKAFLEGVKIPRPEF